MNYWSELGWIALPMTAIELGFTFAMCFLVRFPPKFGPLVKVESASLNR